MIKKSLSLKMATSYFSNMIYLGSYTRNTSKGIYQFENSAVKFRYELSNPTYITQTDDYLYSIFGGDDGCGMAVYDKQKNELVQKVFSDETKGPCHIMVDEEFDVAVTSSYHEHSFHVYRRLNGIWQEPLRVDTFNEASKVHYSYFAKSTQTLYVVDLGLDKIYLYHLDNLSEPYQTLLFPEGVGVRHCVFSQDEKSMYVLSEYSGEIFCFYENKLLSQVKTDPNHMFDEAGAAIRLSMDEKYLAVSLRTKNQIVIYEVEEGYLTEFQRLNTHGEHPRDFNFIDDETLLCANRDTNNLAVFKSHPESKKYEFVESIDAPEIVCISI